MSEHNDGNRKYYWIGLLGLAAFLILPGIWCHDFWAVHEGRRALVALEMMQRHDWLLPTALGQMLLTKPPLFYWLEMICYQMSGGVSVWASRLPSALAGLFGVLAFVQFLRVWLDRESAWWGGLILAVSPLYVWLAQNAEPEMLFMATGLAAMACFGRLVLRGKPSWGWEMGFDLALGLSFMTKGPLVPLTVVLPIVGWLYLGRRPEKLFHVAWSFLLGFLIVLLPSALWFAALLLHGYPAGDIIKEALHHVGAKANQQKSMLSMRSISATGCFPGIFCCWPPWSGLASGPGNGVWAGCVAPGARPWITCARGEGSGCCWCCGLSLPS